MLSNLINELSNKFNLQQIFNSDDFEAAQVYAELIMEYLSNAYGVNANNTIVGQTVFEGTSTNYVVAATVPTNAIIDEFLTISSSEGAVFITEEAAMLQSTLESFTVYVEDNIANNLLAAIKYDT